MTAWATGGFTGASCCPTHWAIMCRWAIIAFIGSWNSFLWPLIIGQTSDWWTVQVVLSTFLTAQTINLPALFMGAAIAVLPLLVLFVHRTALHCGRGGDERAEVMNRQESGDARGSASPARASYWKRGCAGIALTGLLLRCYPVVARSASPTDGGAHALRPGLSSASGRCGWWATAPGTRSARPTWAARQPATNPYVVWLIWPIRRAISRPGDRFN